MATALHGINNHKTNQTARARADQVSNNAGGYVFEVSDKDRLLRFLILGTDGGTYYAGEQELTQQNASFVRSLIKSDPRLVIDTVRDVSVNGRAFKQQPAIFTAALIATEGSLEAKKMLEPVFNEIVRTSTHLFTFMQFIENLGGWGRYKRRLVANWYTSKEPAALAYQAVKYRSRSV